MFILIKKIDRSHFYDFNARNIQDYQDLKIMIQEIIVCYVSFHKRKSVQVYPDV